MKPIRLPIIVATVFLFWHSICPFIGVPDSIIALQFMLSPLVVIWLVIGVLKYGEPSQKKFSDQFYEDRNVVRDQTAFDNE